MMNPFFQQSARRIVSRTSGRKQSSSWAWKTTQFGLLTGTAVVGTAFAREFYSDYQEQQQEQYAAASMNDSSTTNITPPPINQYSLPRSYDRQSVRNYWIRRPVSVVSRLANITYELCPSLVSYGYYTLWLAKQQQISIEELEESKTQQAIQLREALTNLGPAFVKAGQQLAIRPDLVPPVVLKELQKLCDSVRPIPDVIALQLLQEELFGTDTSTCTNNSVVSDDTTAVNNNNTMMTTTTKTNATKTLDDIFEDLHLVASASLGQVYKAKLKESGEYVAIKVQRPGMQQAFSLDLFLLQLWGDFMDAFTSTFTKQVPFHSSLFDTFSHGSYSELDYENEARNQIHFQHELSKRNCPVKVPDVYQKYSTQRILTSEWIDGTKLAESPSETIRQLIPVGVELFLTQLLDIGAFHSDPHPGNLLVTKDGVLCLLDFGLCAEVDERAREAMTKAIVHLLYRDFDSLIHVDTKELGFLPHDFDTEELKPILTKVLTGGLLESGSDLKKRKRKLMEISNELNEIFFQYPFQVPGFFALVTRGLGLLEGIALIGDPNFDIFMASAPYATKRAVSILGDHSFRRLSRSFTSARGGNSTPQGVAEI